MEIIAGYWSLVNTLLTVDLGLMSYLEAVLAS